MLLLGGLFWCHALRVHILTHGTYKHTHSLGKEPGSWRGTIMSPKLNSYWTA